MKKFASLILTMCMLATLLMPFLVLPASAAESLEIINANDNGATTATTTAKEAIAGLGSGTSWYSANRANLTGNISKAVYTLKRSAFVDGVGIAFYNGHEREYRFSIEYSMNKEDWGIAYEKSWSTQQSENNTVEYFEFPEQVEALYLQVTIYDAKVVATGVTNNYGAFYTFEAFGEFDPEGMKPTAELDEAINWINIRKDLHKELYTPESWRAFDDAIKAIDLSTPYDRQEELDDAVAAAKAAQKALVFANLEGLQIAQSYWSDDNYATGSTAWTYGSVIFTEPGYTLDRYKVQNMTLANWNRIFAAPTEEEGVFEITNMIHWGARVTDDEMVPANNYGSGFVIAFYTYNEEELDTGNQWQYASYEFGSRNAAAWEAMDLKIGDKVQLNNVIFTEDQFEEEGEEMQAAWLKTEGSWKHRYWDREDLGYFTMTPIYRQSKVVNPDAVEGGPQYLAMDEFVDFVTYSTMTKVVLSSYTDGNYTYSVSNGKAIITNCDDSISGNVEIPSTLGGYPVTKIANNAFYGCADLTSLILPESVTSIGESAFAFCSDLTDITIPDSVTSIEITAFRFCNNLTIYGYAGSVAEAFATEYKIPFVVISKPLPEGEPTPENPAADEENPAANEENPAVDEENSAANEENPAADEENPAADEENPAADEENPAVDEENRAEGAALPWMILAVVVVLGAGSVVTFLVIKKKSKKMKEEPKEEPGEETTSQND